MTAPIPCPKCSEDLDGNVEVEVLGLVNAQHDWDGKARADLLLRCGSCEFAWNAFVPLQDFFDHPVPEAP